MNWCKKNLNDNLIIHCCKTILSSKMHGMFHCKDLIKIVKINILFIKFRAPHEKVMKF